MDPTEAELESFRQQWREEVTARTRPQVPAPAEPEASSNVANSQKKSKAPAAQAAQPDDDEGSDTEPEIHHGLQDRESGRRAGDGGTAPSSSRQPASALEHYEKAVEKETQGSLGDSVSLYRKAFRVASVYLSCWRIRLKLYIVRRESTREIQSQAFSAVRLPFEAYKRQPLERPRNGAQPCPPLIPWSPFLVVRLDRRVRPPLHPGSRASD